MGRSRASTTSPTHVIAYVCPCVKITVVCAVRAFRRALCSIIVAAAREELAMTHEPRHEPRNIAAEVKDSLVGTIHGAGDIGGAIVDATAAITVKTLRNTGAVGSELVSLSTGVVT